MKLGRIITYDTNIGNMAYRHSLGTFNILTVHFPTFLWAPANLNNCHVSSSKQNYQLHYDKRNVSGYSAMKRGIRFN